MSSSCIWAFWELSSYKKKGSLLVESNEQTFKTLRFRKKLMIQKEDTVITVNI
jgi:hypothetical protein